MLLDLRDEVDRRAAVLLGRLDPQRRVDLRERLREDGVDHDALYLDDLADVARASVRLRHGSPGGWFEGQDGKREGASQAAPVYRSPARRSPCERAWRPPRAPPPGRRGRGFSCRRRRATGSRFYGTRGPRFVTASQRHRLRCRHQDVRACPRVRLNRPVDATGFAVRLYICCAPGGGSSSLSGRRSAARIPRCSWRSLLSAFVMRMFGAAASVPDDGRLRNAASPSATAAAVAASAPAGRKSTRRRPSGSAIGCSGCSSGAVRTSRLVTSTSLSNVRQVAQPARCDSSIFSASSESSPSSRSEIHSRLRSQSTLCPGTNLITDSDDGQW